MSLGFLTESALLPSKAKEIKVDSKSILDLKAVVFQKEQERKERQRRLHEEAGSHPVSRRRKRTDADANGDAMGHSVYARLQAQKQKRSRQDKDKDRNRGVDERRQRDDAQRELDVDNSDDDAALQAKSREMLERKAKLYEQMMQGKGGPDATECLVDFDNKRRMEKREALVTDGDMAGATVEITDEFGRTRVVEKGSREHVEYVKREEKASAESLFFEDKGRDDRDTTTTTSSGSFVVSQWEKTLTRDEKQYLEEVHAGVERAKQSATTDKQRRKQLRLEKLRQQQSQQPTNAAAPTLAPQQDKDAAVQATAFLNQFL